MTTSPDKDSLTTVLDGESPFTSPFGVFSAPGMGEATREAAAFGSRLAVNAALRRFSASWLATRSFSCNANAADCVSAQYGVNLIQT